MVNVSTAFKTAMKQPVKELKSYIKLPDDTYIRSEDDLISVKISGEGALCKTVMRKFEGKYLGEHNLLGLEVNVGIGVKLPDNSYEYIDYGSFLITEITTSKDSGTTTVVGYDLMVKSYKTYNPQFTYPLTLLEYTQEICQSLGIDLGSTEFVNDDWIITEELYENIQNITYRDILTQIAEASGSILMLGTDNKLYFKYPTATSEQITYANLFKLKLEPQYGEINSVVLSRQPQEDNIALFDQTSIETYGLTEFKIINNEIIDDDRQSAITPIYNALKGIKYYPFEADTEGLGWYEIGDQFTIVNDLGQLFDTILFNFAISMDGSIKERLITSAISKTATNYQYAGSINQRIKNTEIKVDKQGQSITSLVSDMYDENGLVNENFTQVFQDIDNIVNSVQNSGGSNLLKNSVMFAYDSNNNPNDWTISGAGTLAIQTSAEALANGGKAGNVFTLNNKYAKQRVYVKTDSPSIPADQKTYYTFYCKVKKDTTGTGYIKIFNENEEYIVDLTGSIFYGDYEIKALLPSMSYYDIEFYGSAGSNCTFTDNMFAIGEYKTLWQQANGEIMNTQVNINLDGVLVRSSIYIGDYTIMSPLEFAGYSIINGTLTKVFSLNKDVTNVTKLKAKDEITMTPIKIVPITTGSKKGWAFVKSL